MGKYKERSVYPASFSGDLIHDKIVVTNDVTIINWTGTDSTFTPTRVDTGTAGSATGTVTFNATDTVAAAAMQVAIRALGGIYANATVVAGVTADNMLITVYGGYNITWIKTGGAGVITETGAAGSDTAVVGSIAYTKQIPIGKFAKVKKIVAKGFVDDVLTVSISDADGKIVHTGGVDTHNAGLDVPMIRLLTADGVAGEDGAAAANTSGGLFRGPLTAAITTRAPYAASAAQPVSKFGDRNELQRPVPRLTLVVEPDVLGGAGRVLQRTTGNVTPAAIAAGLAKLDLGAPIGNIKRIKLENGGPGTPDTSVAPTLTDADGLVVYTKTSTDYTSPVLEQLSHEGFDQAQAAVPDLVDVVAKSPLTLAVSGGLTTGTFKVTAWVEV